MNNFGQLCFEPEAKEAKTCFTPCTCSTNIYLDFTFFQAVYSGTWIIRQISRMHSTVHENKRAHNQNSGFFRGR